MGERLEEVRGRKWRGGGERHAEMRMRRAVDAEDGASEKFS